MGGKKKEKKKNRKTNEHPTKELFFHLREFKKAKMNKLKVLRLRLRSRRENIGSSRQFEVIDVRQTHKMTANS